jgi:AcrR family transcriptional regulator
MGVRERHQRERDAIRRSILDAARQLFVREGFADVSIRRIAELIEYSPAAIYNYFTNKDEIFASLAKEGFDLLSGGPPWPRLDQLPPGEALRLIFRRLYLFSQEPPEYFALMFFERSMPRIVREHSKFDELVEHSRQLFAVVQRCIDAGILPKSLTPVAAFRVLSMGIFGVAALRLSGRLTDADADALATDTIEAGIVGLSNLATVQYRGEWPLQPR